MTDMYLEVYRSWVDQIRGFPRPELNKLTEPGHVVLRYADGQSVSTRMDRAMERYENLIGQYLRKSRPDTPELGVYDMETGTMTWN